MERMSDERLAEIETQLTRKSVPFAVTCGLVFGWHPGLHNGHDWEIPQETGWWCREQRDWGEDLPSFPTLTEALAHYEAARNQVQEGKA
jgi:hypothetical protein